MSHTKARQNATAILMFGFVVPLFGLSAQGLSLGPNFDHIVVYGEGEVTATPDRAEFSAGIEQAAVFSVLCFQNKQNTKNAIIQPQWKKTGRR